MWKDGDRTEENPENGRRSRFPRERTCMRRTNAQSKRCPLPSGCASLSCVCCLLLYIETGICMRICISLSPLHIYIYIYMHLHIENSRGSLRVHGGRVRRL